VSSFYAPMTLEKKDPKPFYLFFLGSKLRLASSAFAANPSLFPEELQRVA
jgi:hypothetical protein